LTNTSSGTIRAQATASSASNQIVDATGVLVINLDGTLNNSGTITAQANANAATAVTQVALAGGVFVGDFSGTLNNSGTISAHVMTVDTSASNTQIAGAAGVSALFFNGGELNNSGTITATANDPANGYSLYLDRFENGGSGTVNNNAATASLPAGLLSGSMYVGGDIIVNNSGTVHVPAGANAHVSGTYYQDTDGVLSIGVLSETEFGNLTVDSVATFESPTEIFVEIEPGFALLDGDYLDNVITANGTYNIDDASDPTTTFGTEVDDNSFLYVFTPVSQTSDDVDLGVSRYSIVDIVLGEGFNSAVGAAGLFDNWFDNGAPTGMEGTLFTLATLGTEEEVAQAVAEVVPVFQGDLSRATLNALADARRIIRARQAELGASSGDSTGSNFWTRIFGSKAEQDNNAGAFGYDADTYGIILGIDTSFGTASTFGAAFAYSQSDVENNSPVFHEGDVDTFQGILYGTFPVSENSEIDWQFNYAGHDNDTKRSMPSWGGLIASGSYDSTSFHIGADIDRAYAVGNGGMTTFTPAIGLAYTKVKDDAYTETGAGIYNLNVAGNDVDQLLLGIDGTLDHWFSPSALFAGYIGFGYDFQADVGTITASFVGDPTSTAFQTTGIDASDWLVYGGLGLTFGADDSMQFSIEYDIQAGNEDFINQSASLKLNIPF
jgi:outer membrane autotransporter protein